MSEEKLYAVKNDKGEWLNQYCFWGPEAWAKPDKDDREKVAKHYGGHVVAFVEEPEKEAVSENEGKAIDSLINAETYAQASEAFHYLFASRKKEDIKRIMKAFRNGYTVAKEKKYRVITPKSWWASENEPEYMHMNVLNGIENYKGADDDTLFTQKQLDLYGLNGAPFTKEEVTDDDE
ncbi:DUF1642 domain-containing protein [Lacticaseibacillus paracasei]|uniref:DUF1642 domain-containing protein n=1 Tax=Lacticaseibacillus paracasei TaxID=1597 RepID=UPI003DA5E197